MAVWRGWQSESLVADVPQKGKQTSGSIRLAEWMEVMIGTQPRFKRADSMAITKVIYQRWFHFLMSLNQEKTMLSAGWFFNELEPCGNISLWYWSMIFSLPFNKLDSFFGCSTYSITPSNWLEIHIYMPGKWIKN